MISVFKSILGKAKDEVSVVLETLSLQENQQFLSVQEKDVVRFLSQSAQATTLTPSEELFLKKFPEFTVPFSKESGISSMADVSVQLSLIFNKRHNQRVSSELMKIATSVVENGLTHEDAVKIGSLVQEDKTEEVDVTKSADQFREFYEKKKQLPAGLQFFVKEIDQKVGGIAPGMCCTIGGYTGAGKSTFAINIAYQNAKQNKYNICYISMEMTKEDVLFDLLCRHSTDKKFDKFPYIGHQKIRTCTMTSEEEDYLMNTVLPDYYQTGGMITILDETDFKSLTKVELRQKLEQVDDEMIAKTGYPLDAVFWDHMNLFKFSGSGKTQSEGAAINEYVSYVRQLGLNFRRDSTTGEKRKLAMFMLAQINREGWKRAVKNKGAYDLRSLADANELERASAVVVSIFTDDDLKGAKEATACLLKNRNGAPIGSTVSLYADMEAYLVGDEMAGFNDVMTVSDVENVFESGDPVMDLFE